MTEQSHTWTLGLHEAEWKYQCSYRVSLATGSYWSSENPFDVPQLSVTQMGGTDHNVVARHWIRLLFKYFWDRNVDKTASRSFCGRFLTSLSLLSFLLPSIKSRRTHQGCHFPPSLPLNANVFPLFSKFLWLSAHLRSAFVSPLNILPPAPPLLPSLVFHSFYF